MNRNQIQPADYAPFYQPYFDAVGDGDLLEELEISLHSFIHFVREVPIDKIDYRYAPGKWTLKDIIQHLIDAERVFAYRALRIGRNDRTPLPGFEENEYAADAGAEKHSINQLLSEFSEVRFATLSLFRSLGEERMQRSGTASERNITVGALGFIIIGHQKHHQRVFRERYL